MGLIVDLFAGGGGVSTGIEMALGRGPDIAINHDPEAIAMHTANHPQTRHYCENIWKVNPREAVNGQEVDFLWASPDCKHFSKAKGGKPKDRKIRSLAWSIIRWAAWTRPRVIAMENVEEFCQWGPLDRRGMPIKALAGTTFNNFVNAFHKLGYKVDYRVLHACDYGAPTIRKRFFLIARRDGESLVWPRKTNGPGTGRPYKTAAECIDWDIPCQSIFERVIPLKPNTLRRIAKGIVKYVINNPSPFIIKFRTGAVGADIMSPIPTITSGGESKRPAGSPHALGLVVPTLVKQNFGETPCQNVTVPLHTITTQHNKFAPSAAFLIQYHGETSEREMRGQSLFDPLMVVDSSPRYALCAANLIKNYSGVVGQPMDAPIGTVTSVDHHSLVACTLMRQFGTSNAADIERPLGTVMPDGYGKTGLVAVFLDKYYGNEQDGCNIFDPAPTVTSKDRKSVIEVSIEGESFVISDIGMRMLQPKELFAAHGFPSDYVISFDFKGKPLSKSAQVKMVGNSVCPPIASAIIRANCEFMMREEQEVA